MQLKIASLNKFSKAILLFCDRILSVNYFTDNRLKKTIHAPIIVASMPIFIWHKKQMNRSN